MRSLGSPSAAWAGDDGRPDMAVRTLLAAVHDSVSYARAVAGLCLARLLLPIAEDPDGDLSAVRTTAPDGRTGLLVFTGLDALQAWNPAARPVPCTLDDVAATAVETGSDAVVVDLAGPVSLVIEDDLIAGLASGQRLVELPDGGFGWLLDSSDQQPAGEAGKAR